MQPIRVMVWEPGKIDASRTDRIYSIGELITWLEAIKPGETYQFITPNVVFPPSLEASSNERSLYEDLYKMVCDTCAPLLDAETLEEISAKTKEIIRKHDRQ